MLIVAQGLGSSWPTNGGHSRPAGRRRLPVRRGASRWTDSVMADFQFHYEVGTFCKFSPPWRNKGVEAESILKYIHSVTFLRIIK